MLRTWSETGSILVAGGVIDASGNPPGPTPGGGGGAGGSIVLLSRSVTLSNATLSANGANADGGGGTTGKVVIATSSLFTNASTTLEAKPGGGAYQHGGKGGAAGNGGLGGAPGMCGPGGAGGKGGAAGKGNFNPNKCIGGDGGEGGEGGEGGAGGAPGDCFWLDYLIWLICYYDDWFYWDWGFFPGYGWEQPWFDDSSWKIGRGEFGYGEGDEVTPVISTNQFKTVYFRQHFDVTNIYSITNLSLMLRRDDGVIVYLNGVEVLRDNMPLGPVSNSTPASVAAPDDGTRMLMVPIQHYLLREGTNLLAAEVHQSLNSGGDMSFDLRLVANAKTPSYTQVFPSGQTAFIPQLMTRSNGVWLSELFNPPRDFLQVLVPTGAGFASYVYDPDDMAWMPSDLFLLPGQGVIVRNPGARFEIEVRGLPPVPRTLQLQPEVPALVGRQAPGPASFKDIMGYAPLNGTEVARLPSSYSLSQWDTNYLVYRFRNGSWQPQEPIARRGEAMWIKLPCAYIATPSNLVVEAQSPFGATVSYPLPLSNYCGGQVTQQYYPPSGSLLPLGTHVVTCEVKSVTATNSYFFTVSVLDTTAPAIQCPNLAVESTNAAGVRVQFNISASDQVDPAPHLICTPPSGTLFPMGVSVVRCLAWDAMGNTNQSEFLVTVADTRPPQIICPANVTLVKSRAEGTPLSYQIQAADLCDTNLMIEYSMPPGATFAPGTTIVECIVIDASGNQNTCSFEVRVVDAQPGFISGMRAAAQAVNLSFPSQTGVEYQIEYKNSLDEADWQPLATMTGTGAEMTIVDPDPAESMRFYRVRSP
jgi:hypothetical protein